MRFQSKNGYDIAFLINQNKEINQKFVSSIFHRLCYTAIVNSTKSSEIAKHLKPAHEFFQGTFKKFTSDRGKIIKKFIKMCNLKPQL